MTRRKHAQGTKVAIGASRGQIDKLLRDWGVDGIQWTDYFKKDMVQLEFVWEHEGNDYLARIKLGLPTAEDLEDEAIDGRSGRVSEAKLRKLMAERGKREHRLLRVFLLGAFEAIEAGVISAEQLFLPYLVGADGRTVGEVAEERLPVLLAKSAGNLLPGKGETK
jgi:hypothetical protein